MSLGSWEGALLGTCSWVAEYKKKKKINTNRGPKYNYLGPLLEALNNVGGIAARNKKNIPLEVAGMSMKLCGSHV